MFRLSWDLDQYRQQLQEDADRFRLQQPPTGENNLSYSRLANDAEAGNFMFLWFDSDDLDISIGKLVALVYLGIATHVYRAPSNGDPCYLVTQNEVDSDKVVELWDRYNNEGEVADWYPGEGE